jgi:hypothetical protein
VSSGPSTAEAQGASGALPGRTRRLVHLGLGLAASVGLALSGLPLCPTAAVAGFPCPACGMTRASLATLRGDLAAAYALHPLVFVALPVLALVLSLAGREYVERGRFELPRPLSGKLAPVFVAVFVAMVALWLARFGGAFGGPVPVERIVGHALVG